MDTDHNYEPNAKKSRCMMSPLFHCIRYENKENIVDILQKEEINLTAGDKQGNTLLHLVLENSELTLDEKVEVLEKLLVNNFNVNIKNKKRLTVLHIAIQMKLEKAVDLLIKRDAKIYICDRKGNSLAHFFINSEYEKYVKITRNRGNLVYSHDDELASASFVEFLILKGVNFDHRNNDGKSALHLAIDYDLQHVLPILLQHSTDINFVEKNTNKNFLHLFLEAPDRKINATRFIQRKVVEVVEILLKNDCNVNQRDNSETRPIHLILKQTEYFDKLLDLFTSAGCDINAKNCKGYTVLHILAESYQIGIMRKLISHGADVNCRTSYSLNTPLHLAVEFDFKGNTIKLLLECGANVNVRNKDKLSVLARAIKSRNYSMIHEMLKYGADINETSVISELVMAFSEFYHVMCNHFIILKTDRLPCSKNYDRFINEKEFKNFQIDCLQVIEILKKTLIDEKMSVYNFLHLDQNKKCFYINNEKLKELVDSPDLEKKFPNYSTIIVGSYKHTVIRKSLLKLANKGWIDLIGIYLPDICVELILRYLDNSDLADIAWSE